MMNDIFLFASSYDEVAASEIARRLAEAGLDPRREFHLELLPPLLVRLRETLVRCSAFRSDDALRTVCVDARLNPWRESLPHADSPAARVEAVIAFLQNRYTTTQENALVLLVCALADQVAYGDTHRQRLITLASDLERALLAGTLRASTVCIVCIGQADFLPYGIVLRALLEQPEMRDTLPRLVILLLPEVSRERLTGGLETLPWVQFTHSLDEPDAWAKALRLLREIPTPPSDAECPYRGLEYFDVEHAHFFFGREELTRRLLERLAEHRFLAIIGPSGSGKSSVARAGLLYHLQQDALPGSASWRVVTVTPTAHPLESLALGLRSVLRDLGPNAIRKDLQADAHGLHLLAQAEDAAAPLLVFVDQFEEVFTLCRDEDERQLYLDNLLYAAHRADGDVRVVLTMRADFYGKCAAYPALRDALERSQVLVGPLSDDEVRRAIELPAARAGLELETGLVDEILGDVRAQPGNLPLLQYALRELWEAREVTDEGVCLTLHAYIAIGKVQGALARRADEIYTSFTSEEQTCARHVFLRLTELGEGTEDTRRRVSKAELTALQIPIAVPTAANAEASNVVDTVIQRLTDKRLITTSRDETGAEWVDVAHEALIRGWPRLQGWLTKDRASLRQHRQLTEAVQEWVGHGHDADYLFRGGRLAAAREWLAGRPSVLLTDLEHTFIQRSVASELRRKRTTRGSVVVAFTLITMLGIIAFVFGLRSNEQAQDLAIQADNLEVQATALATAYVGAEMAHQTAVAGEAEAVIARQTAVAGEEAARQSQLEAEYQTRAVLARQIASTAALLRARDPQFALLLAQEAISTTYFPDGYTTLEANAVLRGLLVSGYEPSLVITHTARLGHTEVVESAAYSPDGTRIVTASRDGTARVWDASTSQELLKLEGHTETVQSAAYSPDGARIVTASDDNTARVWDATTGQELLTLIRLQSDVRLATYSPDGACIVTASWDHIAKVWDAATGQELITLAGHTGFVQSAAYSPDGKRIVTASRDKTAKVWDAATGQELLTLVGHTRWVESAAYSPDGARIVTAGDDFTARVWDATTGQELLTLEGHGGTVYSAVYSPDGTRIATASEVVRVWDAATGQELFELEGHTGYVFSVMYSPDGMHIVTASWDHTARVWDAATGQVVLVGARGDVESAAYSPDGTHIVTASDDDTAQVWDAATGQELMTLEGHTHWIGSAAYSPDGKRIITASRDKTAKVWDAATGQELLTLVGHTRWVESAAYSPDGARIVTASEDDTARVWGATTGQELLTLEGHSGDVNSAGYSPDGARIVTTSDDHTARVWDAATGQELMTLEGHTEEVSSAVYSPDGARIVTASKDDTARVWDATTGQELLKLEGHTGYVYSVMYSPDGTRIVTASDDHTARVWDAATGQELMTLEGHTGSVRSAVYSPDGVHIVTASSDSTTWVWQPRRVDQLALSGGIQAIFHASFDASGKYVAAAGQGEGAAACIWAAESGDEVTCLEGHGQGIPTDTIQCPHCINTIVFSTDGDQVLTAGWDGTTRVWDARSGKVVWVLEGHTGQVTDAQFDPTGQVIATSGRQDKTVRVWDATTGQSLYVLETPNGTNYLDFSPNGALLVAAGADGNAWVWDVVNGQKTANFQGDGNALIRAIFSPDGQRVAAGGFGSKGFVWNVATGKRVATLEGHRALAKGEMEGSIWQIVYSPRGDILATAGQDGTARLWDAETGEERFVLRGHEGIVWSVAFSPDGRQVATGGEDGTVRLWNAQTGMQEAILPDYKGTESLINWENVVIREDAIVFDKATIILRWVRYVSYSPSGDQVVAAGMDGSVMIYVAPTEKLLELAHSQTTRNLTCQERVQFLYERRECPYP